MRLLTPSGWLRRETLSNEGENSDLGPPGRPDIVHLTVLDRDFFVIKASADEFYISSFCLAFFSRCARLMISAITTCERCYASPLSPAPTIVISATMGEKASESTRLVTVFHFNRQQLRNEKNSFVARPTTMPAPVWSEKLFFSIASGASLRRRQKAITGSP